jgi:hypothetical protein
LLVKRFFFLLNAAFAMAILDLIWQVHLPSSVNMLPRYLKHFIFSSCFWSITIATGVGCLEILITFVFFPHLFPCHSTFQFQLVYQSCPVAPFFPRNMKNRAALARVLLLCQRNKRRSGQDLSLDSFQLLELF